MLELKSKNAQSLISECKMIYGVTAVLYPIRFTTRWDKLKPLPRAAESIIEM